MTSPDRLSRTTIADDFDTLQMLLEAVRERVAALEARELCTKREVEHFVMWSAIYLPTSFV